MKIKCPICFDSHSLFKLFKCDNFLSSILASKISLHTEEIKIKTTLKKNQCENCKRILSSSLNYKKHIKSNVCKEKIFFCNKCNKIFQKKQNLQYHIEHDVCNKNLIENINDNINDNTFDNTINNLNDISNSNTNDNLMEEQSKKYKKVKISLPLKKAVWYKYVGCDIGSVYCF